MKSCLVSQPVGSAPAVQLRHLLLPTDFSAASRQALPMAIGLAHHFGASITLIHVVPTNLPAEVRHLGVVLEARQLAQEAERSLATFRRNELPEDIVVECLVRDGGPPTQITEAARETKADLIVLSTHGYSGWKHAWLGSTAERVVRQAPCPVLTLRGDSVSFRFPNDDAGCFRKILVASDFAPPSNKALRYATALGACRDAQYRLLHVVEPPAYPEFGYVHVPMKEAGRKSDAMARLESEAQESMGELFDRTEKCVRVGCASTEIVAEARESNCDLIVVGTHGGSALSHLLLGSTAEQVIRQAACPVLVVREEQREFVTD